MAERFHVPSHAIFFNGYLDAVGRHFSDDTRLCAMSSSLLPAQFLELHEVVKTTAVKDMISSFSLDIAQFLNADTRIRLVYYLIEYFEWFESFSTTCVAEKLQLSGDDLPPDHLAYRLTVDHSFQVLFIAYWKNKAGHV